MCLQNILVNGTFSHDPDDYDVSHEAGNGYAGPVPYGGWLPGAPSVQPQMPAWALRDSAPEPRVPPNNANAWVNNWWTPSGPPPYPLIGPTMGAIFVNNLQAGDTFDFYQPVHRSVNFGKVEGTATGASTPTVITTANLPGYANDYFNGFFVRIILGRDQGASAVIVDFRQLGATQEIQVATAFPLAPNGTSVFEISNRTREYQGKDVSFRCAVYSTNPAAAVQAFIRTDAGYVLGTVHSGLGAWEVLYVMATLPDPCQIFEVGIQIHDTDSIFMDACTCVVGVLDPALPFIARQEEDDRNAINSMLFPLQDEFEIWAPPSLVPGSPTTFRHTVTYPVTLRDWPYVDIAGTPLPWSPQQAGVWPPPPATPPGSALFFPGGTWNVWRESLSYSVGDAAGWACPLPWDIYVNLTLDARPT